MPSEFSVGTFRGVMLPGGRSARLSLRRAFPRALIDAPVLDMAHSAEGASRAAAMGANWVFLVYSWGLPPELDEVDRLGFSRVVRLYHQAGLRVMAGVNVSSYVPHAGYTRRSWAALDSTGKPIPFQPGRVYACWNAAEWLAEVEGHLRGALDAGADGVWLIAPWAGGVPARVGGGLLGTAGCHCSRCRAAYAEAAGGARVPRLITLSSRAVQVYLEWRADLTTRRIAAWAAAARAQHPDAAVAADGPPEQGQLATLRYGHDPDALSAHVDLYLVPGSFGAAEDMAPAATAVGIAQARLAGRAQAIGVLGEAFPSGGTEQQGVGNSRVLQAATSASAGLGSPALVGGILSGAGRSLTLILDKAFHEQRDALAHFHAWIEAQRGWIGNRANASPLAIYAPPVMTWWKNRPVEGLVEAACEAVIRLGYPLRVVSEGDWDDVQTLIVPPGPVPGLEERLVEFAARNGRVIALQQARTGSAGRPLWTAFDPDRPGWRHWPGLRRVTQRAALVGARWHTGGRLKRTLARRLRLPGPAWRDAGRVSLSADLVNELAMALAAGAFPRAQAEQPVLFVIWREAMGGQQWHLVNAGEEPQRVTLSTPGFINGWVVAPGQDEPTKIFGSDVVIRLDTYKVLRLPSEPE